MQQNGYTMNQLKTARRKLQMEQAVKEEPFYIDGVLVALPRGVSEEERKNAIAEYKAIIDDPDSGFNSARSRKKAARERFDKRRAFLAEVVGQQNQSSDNEEQGKIGPFTR